MSGYPPRRRNRPNDTLAIILVLLVGAAPLLLGGNRPILWLAGSALIGLIALSYAVLLLASGGVLRVQPRQMPLEAALVAVLSVFLLLQALPLANFGFDPGFRTVDGSPLWAPAFSLAPGETLLMLVRTLGYALFFVLALQVAANRRRARLILVALTLVVSFQALVGLLALGFGDTMLGLPKTAYFGSATGGFVNRNSFADFMALGLVAGVAALIGVLAADENDSPGLPDFAHPLPALLILCLLTMGAALFASHSRMGSVSALAGIAVTLGLGLGKPPTARNRALLAIAGACLLAFPLILFGGGLIERLGGVEAAGDVRASLYAQVAGMIASRPFSGYGGGSFALAFSLFHAPPVSTDVVWDKAHSTYLGLWADLGIVFGSLPPVVFALIGCRVWRGRARAQREAAAALGALCAMALHATVDFGMEMTANVYLLLALLAIGCAGSFRRQQRGERESHPQGSGAQPLRELP